MSLVAYGASDDSETSDVEASETSQATGSGDANDRSFAADGKISDEEDYVPTAKIQIPSSAGSSSAVISTREAGINSVHTPSTLSDLPAPKPRSTAEEVGEGEDELEEEVKPKASQLADAPKPPPKKTKQPTRIILPALKKDSDDEEEEESRKKIRLPAATTGASGSRSGLFALLPPPTHTSVKQTNRTLIPYTLTKKPAAAKTKPKPSPTSTTTTTITTTTSTTTTDTLPSQKHQSAFNALTGYESDSDEEEGQGQEGAVPNFFSIGSEEAADKTSSAGLSLVKNAAPSIEDVDESGAETADVNTRAPPGAGGGSAPRIPSSSLSQPSPSPFRATLNSPSVSSSSFSSSSSAVSSNVSAIPAAAAAASTSRKLTGKSVVDIGDGGDGDDNDDGDNDDEVSSTSVGGVPVVNQDAPLNFSSSAMQQTGASWRTAPLTSPMVPEMYAAPVGSSAATYWQQQQHYAQGYTGTGEEEQVASSSSGQDDIYHYMQDEQFQRISGKRKRGKEDIQIIDANVDDHVDPSELMKGISEESSYQPHRKKDNLPSSQQRRKKQITYLAFQAKERELELKNQWSQNRMTKNQARSKYGF